MDSQTHVLFLYCCSLFIAFFPKPYWFTQRFGSKNCLGRLRGTSAFSMHPSLGCLPHPPMNLHFLWTFFVIRIFVTLHVPALNFSWALTFLILFPSACAKLLYSSFAACPTFNFLHALLCCREALCLASRERLSVQIPGVTMWQVPSAHLNLLLSSHELFFKNHPCKVYFSHL